MSRIGAHYIQFITGIPPVGYTDSGTVTFALTPSGTDIGPPIDYLDTGTARVTLTASGVGGTEFSDPGTELLHLTPATAYEDTGQTTEFAIAELALTPGGSEFPSTIFPMEDVGTLLFHLTPSTAQEGVVHVDVGTELFHLTPITIMEERCPQKVEFIGDLNSRWFSQCSIEYVSAGQSAWDAVFLGVGQGYAC